MVTRGSEVGGGRVARRRWRRVAAVALAAAVVAGCSGGDGDDGGGSADSGPGTTATSGVAHPRDAELRLNEIQVLGTHNSYHRAPTPEFVAGLDTIIPGLTAAWMYEHAPLPDQFATQGIRQIELDVWADPDGRYAQRKAQAYAGMPLEPVPELREPGLKVFHVMEIDVESTCWTFVACLEELETWSAANPGHVPVLVLVEAKADAIPDPLELGFTTPIPFDAAQLDAVDAEIRSVFDDDQLITPDLVRGDAATLEEAVLTSGWPTLDRVRGRVMFALDNGGEVMEAYQAGHPSLEGRVMFTGGDPAGTPETAFMKLNDPIEDGAAITEAVRAGYVVRTRADAEAVLEPEPPLAMREAALSSGAQFVSTDYPVPDPSWNAEYSVSMPGGTPARCNPVTAPSWCTPADVEDPTRLSP